jgi:hypothetical protein
LTIRKQARPWLQDATKRLPGLPVLYASGQSVTDGMEKLFGRRCHFVAKPYAPNPMQWKNPLIAAEKHLPP